MKKAIYYIILICVIVVLMPCMAFVSGSLLGFDSVVVKGLTAGIGLYVVYNRNTIFDWLDKKFKL